jgi:integrase/recombinase XerD
MAKQAKTFTSVELRRVLDYVATRKHSARNRTMVLLTHWGGLRVGEVAQLRYSDVLDDEGSVKREVLLRAETTKGNNARTLFVSDKLHKELTAYVRDIPATKLSEKLFYTQKSEGFSANTLAQFFYFLYKNAGIANASSHSGRRTFITTLADKGVGVRVLMSLAGHKSIGTTQAYIDVNDGQKRKAVELL